MTILYILHKKTKNKKLYSLDEKQIITYLFYKNPSFASLIRYSTH